MTGLMEYVDRDWKEEDAADVFASGQEDRCDLRQSGCGTINQWQRSLLTL